MSKTSTHLKGERKIVQAAPRDDPLLAAWDETLRENGKRAAILDRRGGVVRTFSEIETRAGGFARQLDRFEPGQVIAIQIGNHPDWPSLLLACLRKRVVVLPLEQTMSDEQRQAVFATCGVAAAAVTSSRAKPRDREEVTFESTPRDPSAALRSTQGDGNIRWQKNQPSLLKLTSGTTAAPRVVRFRSQQLLADCENICDTMGIGSGDLNFGVVPMSHSYGFSNLLTPLLAHGIPLALSDDRLPRAIVDGLAATRATVFAGMPVFYQALCDLSALPPLPALRLCISAGAPLSLEVAATFQARFGREIHSFYGSSECGGICYARAPQRLAGFVGEAMRGVNIEMLEPGNASSLIRVRSKVVADGYYPYADETKLGNGSFVPDDLLEKTPQGYRIVGRVSDLINVAGKKVNPAEVEAELLRCEGVREAVVFGRESGRRNEEVAACIVAGPETSETDVMAFCRARLSSWQRPRRIFLVDALPVSERGKISRRELARRYAAAK